MPNKIKVDIAIIGCGTAGMQAYKEAKKSTDSIALIEAAQYGTTCARVGCMPSKLLIAAAEASHAVDQAKEFGIEIKTKTINAKKVMQRVRDERDRFVSFVLETVKTYDQKHLYKSFAKFVDNHTLELDNGDLIEAKAIIIAAGSRSNIPEIFNSAEEKLIISDDVFYWQDLPESLAVIGTGIIGIELGQALSRLGVRTKIFGRSKKIAALQDPDLIELAAEIFTEELNMELNSSIDKVEKTNNAVKITYKNNQNKTIAEEFAGVLVATGRVSNLDKLSLANTKVKLNDKNIPIIDAETCQSSEAHIFIAGDAAVRIPLLHEASDEGRIAGKNAVNYIHSVPLEKHKRKCPTTILFCDPQIMQIGMGYKELIDTKTNFVSGEASFVNQGRARSFLINKGAIKIYAEKHSGLLLGAEMIGPDAEHLAHLLAWSKQSNLTIKDLLARPFYHPTVEEGLKTALQNTKY